MADTTDDDTGPVAKFGTALEWALMQAFQAFAREQPEAAANLWRGVETGEVRLRLTATVGGGKMAGIDCAALLPDGSEQPLASMTVAAAPKLN